MNLDLPALDRYDLSDFPPDEQPRIRRLMKLWAFLEALRAPCMVRDKNGVEHHGKGWELLAKADPNFEREALDYIRREYLENRPPIGSA